MTDREIMKMALKALENVRRFDKENLYGLDDDITALEEQLAQLEKEQITQAVQTVIQAIQNDPEYAWGWHCNIAMAFVDAGGDCYTANQGAARFIEMFAKVQPAHELPSPELLEGKR